MKEKVRTHIMLKCRGGGASAMRSQGTGAPPKVFKLGAKCIVGLQTVEIGSVRIFKSEKVLGKIHQNLRLQL